MPRKLRTLLQLLLFAALGVGVGWYMFSRMSAAEKREMAAAVQQMRQLLLLPFLGVTLLSCWSRARRWQLLLHPLGIFPGTRNTLYSVLIGYLVNLVPPRAGEVAKCTVLARYEKVPADKMIGTIVAERAWDVVCLGLLAAGTLAWQASVMDAATRARLLEYLPQGNRLLLPGLAALLGTGLLFALYRLRPGGRLSRLIAGLAAGVASIFRLRARGAFLFHTVLIWACYLLQVLLGFWALPGTAHLGAGPGLMVLLFGSVAMAASPGGLGLYPFLTALILITGYGIAPASAHAFGWVTWGLMTVFVLLLGLAALFLLPFTNRTPPHDRQTSLDTGADIHP